MKRLENNGIYFEDSFYDKDELLDLMRLKKVLLKEENIIASLSECANIWHRHSNDCYASYLFFPAKDEEILMHIKSDRGFTSFEDYAK